MQALRAPGRAGHIPRGRRAHKRDARRDQGAFLKHQHAGACIHAVAIDAPAFACFAVAHILPFTRRSDFARQAERLTAGKSHHGKHGIARHEAVH
jgi:hypothetical protein